MKTRRNAILGVVAAVCAIGVVCQLAHSREPVYRGKPLSCWLEHHWQKIVASRTVLREDDVVRDEEGLAIRQFGTNSFPYLLRLASSEDSLLKQFIRDQFPSSKSAMARLYVGRKLLGWARRPVTDPAKASLGFRIFGPAAQPVVPELIQILSTSRNSAARKAAVFGLGCIGPAASNAIPVLLENFKDADVFMRRDTTSALMFIAWDRRKGGMSPGCSELMVKGLTELLADPKTDKPQVIGMLGGIGPAAKPALPAILRFQDSQDAAISAAAIEARESIEAVP